MKTFDFLNFLGISDQLNEIRKTTLARVLCDNGDAMDAIQQLSMQPVTGSNPRKRCTGNEIPRIDLTLWEEGEFTHYG